MGAICGQWSCVYGIKGSCISTNGGFAWYLRQKSPLLLAYAYSLCRMSLRDHIQIHFLVLSFLPRSCIWPWPLSWTALTFRSLPAADAPLILSAQNKSCFWHLPYSTRSVWSILCICQRQKRDWFCPWPFLPCRAFLIAMCPAGHTNIPASLL